MSTLIGDEVQPRARKGYFCMAAEQLLNGDFKEVFRCCTYAEKKSIVRAKRNQWRIQPGQRYIRQAVVWEGQLGTFRAIPEIHGICTKYNLYEDC